MKITKEQEAAPILTQPPADRPAPKGQTPSDLSESVIQQTASAELELSRILQVNLSWSHYERLMRIDDDDSGSWEVINHSS